MLGKINKDMIDEALTLEIESKSSSDNPAFTGTATLNGVIIETTGLKGVANGYAPLGSDGLVPSVNLPVNGSYKGNWDASTNTPTIVAATGTNGDNYTVSVAGTQSITGSSVAFTVGDQLRYTTNGNKWERIPNSQSVASVAGLIGTISYSDLKNALVLTKTDIGLTNVDNTSDLAKPISAATQTALDLKEPNLPEGGSGTNYLRGDKTWVAIGKTTVGLANVDNTSDANKPISTATQTALNAKEPVLSAGTTAQYYRGDKSWQTLNKAVVGLDNVDNTSDLNKPVSTAQAAALQPLNSGLTSISSLTTASYGLSFLSLTDAAASRTYLGLGTASTVNTGTSGSVVPLLSASNTFGGTQTFSSVKVGSSTTVSFGGITNPSISQHGGGGSGGTIAVGRWVSNAGGGGRLVLAKSRSDVIGTFAAVTTNDDIGGIQFWGDNGTAMTVGAAIYAYASEVFSSTVSGTYLSFFGTAPGSNTHSEWLRLSNTSFRPSVTNTRSLGESSLQWSNVYSNAITTANAQITGGLITGITDLALADGGTGSSTASGARTNLGLGNVDNTSDANKPVSTAQAAAISSSAATLQPLNSRLTSLSTGEAEGRAILALPFNIPNGYSGTSFKATIAANNDVCFAKNAVITVASTSDRPTQPSTNSINLNGGKVVFDYSDTSASTQMVMGNLCNGTIELATGRSVRRFGRVVDSGRILRDMTFRSVDYTSDVVTGSDYGFKIEETAVNTLLDNITMENIGYGFLVAGNNTTIRNLNASGMVKGIYSSGASGCIITGLRWQGTSPLATPDAGINAISGQWNDLLIADCEIGPSADGTTLPKGTGEHGIYLSGIDGTTYGNIRIWGVKVRRTGQCGVKIKDVHTVHIENVDVQQANYASSALVNKEGFRFERITGLIGGNLNTGSELIGGVVTGSGGYTHMFFGPCSGVRLLKESFGENCLTGGVRFAVDGVDAAKAHGDYVLKLRHKTIGGPSVILDNNVIINEEILIYLNTDGCPASPISIGTGITWGPNGKLIVVGTYKNCGAPPPVSTTNVDLSNFIPAGRTQVTGFLRPESQYLLNSYDVVPSRKAIFAIDDIIQRLTDENIWAKIITFWGGLAGSSQVNSLRDWKDPYAANIFTSGTPVFTANRGWAGDGTSGLLNTSIPWSSVGTQDNKSFGVWVSNDVQTDVAAIGSTSSSGSVSLDRITPRNTGNLSVFRVASGTESTISNTSAIGHYTATRLASTTQNLYKDGVLLSSNAVTSAAGSGGNVRMLGTGTNYSSVRLSAAYTAVGLTAEEVKILDGVMYDYMVAVGVINNSGYMMLEG